MRQIKFFVDETFSQILKEQALNPDGNTKNFSRPFRVAFSRGPSK